MPPEHGRSRPGQAAPPKNATDVESTTTLHELPLFSWHQCPLHPVLAVSVIVTADSLPWCVGAAEVHGHPVDPAELRRSVAA